MPGYGASPSDLLILVLVEGSKPVAALLFFVSMHARLLAPFAGVFESELTSSRAGREKKVKKDQ